MVKYSPHISCSTRYSTISHCHSEWPSELSVKETASALPSGALTGRTSLFCQTRASDWSVVRKLLFVTPVSLVPEALKYSQPSSGPLALDALRRCSLYVSSGTQLSWFHVTVVVLTAAS